MCSMYLVCIRLSWKVGTNGLGFFQYTSLTMLGFTVRPAQSVAARTEGSWWWREPWAKWAANASSTYLRLLVQGSAGASRRARSGASAARAGQSSTTMNYVPREKGQGEIETVKISPIELLPMISPLKSFLVIYFRGLLAQLCGPWKSRISLNLVPMDT